MSLFFTKAIGIGDDQFITNNLHLAFGSHCVFTMETTAADATPHSLGLIFLQPQLHSKSLLEHITQLGMYTTEF